MKRYAIFFPQFHETKVNDLAWGQGFTDWALVAAANAFSHWERRAPASGFYDLSRETDLRARFIEASTSGLDGFGIYHYRFDDGPELNAVEQYLYKYPLPNQFRYFFIWANESWSKRWVNNDTKTIKSISKEPSRKRVNEHVAYLKPYMQSDSYARMGDRSIFVMYRPDWFNNSFETISLYREAFKCAGLDVSIGFFAKNVADAGYSRLFDFCYIFEPRMFFNFHGLRKNSTAVNLYKKMLAFMPPEKGDWLSEHVNKFLRKGANKYPFEEFLSYFSSERRRDFIKSLDCPVQNILTAGWNNAPRYRQHFTQVEVPTSEQFSIMLDMSLSDSSFSKDIPLLCNAWNEWSEGAAIEPCAYLGNMLLNAYLSQSDRLIRENGVGQKSERI